MGKKKFGKCKLCQNEKELRFSHIIPEFIYSPVYDESHRYLIISEGKEKFQQKGVREYLLCGDCEGEISKFESYSSPIIKSIQNLSITQFGDQYIIHNVHYTEFKLLQLSLLWRASVATVNIFDSVDIGHHEEIIRKMLVTKNPGIHKEYSCIMFVLDDTKHIHKTILSPVKDLIDGNICYRFLTGRIFWYFFLAEEYPKDVENYFLSSDGTLCLIKAPWSEEVVTQRLLGNVAKKYFRSTKGDNPY